MTGDAVSAVSRIHVTRAVEVEAAATAAFELFSSGIDAWWPRNGFSVGAAPMRELVLEPRVGGRWFERDANEVECSWGRVLVWDPPRRLVLGWQLSSQWAYDQHLMTEVEITFTELDGSRTLVRLTHSLDGYGADAERMRAVFDEPTAWEDLLAAYAVAATPVTFDRYTVVRLVLRTDAPELTETEANDLQDRHLNHTATMVAAGHLLAAGPALGGDEPEWRGLSIWATDAETTRSLSADDPAVRAGRLMPLISTWMVPRNQLQFGRAHVPRSIADVG
jgi:uncharacterized protein YndB with AHSA1/START domain/uncharacterized protein YciI